MQMYYPTVSHSMPSEGRVHGGQNSAFHLYHCFLGNLGSQKLYKRMWLPKPSGDLPNFEYEKNPMQKCLFLRKVTHQLVLHQAVSSCEREYLITHKLTKNTSYF